MSLDAPTLAALLRGADAAAGSAAPWLDARRAEALERAQSLALPTTRDEDWRFTDISPIARRSWLPAAPPRSQPTAAPEPQPGAAPGSLLAAALGPQPAAAAIPAALALPEAAARLVFVDGLLAPEACATARAGAALGSARRPSAGDDSIRSAGARPLAGPLATMLAACPDPLRAHLARHAPIDQVFTAINTAFLQEAAVVLVPRDTAEAAPVHVVHLGTRPEGVHYARLLVVAEPGADVLVVEEYAGSDGADYLVNAVTEIVVGPGARVRHVRIQGDGPAAFHVGTVAVSLGRDARYESQSIAFGARLSRLDPRLRFDGPGAVCRLDGLALIGERQLADTHSFVDHAAPDCTSRQTHRCIVDGAAHAVFNGKIVVRPGAQRTDSAQENRNLLLGPRARVDAKPQLEIFADDVKCAHGATVGQLDTEQLFYLQSRGLAERTARNVLTTAFAAELFGRIPVDSLRRRLEAHVLARTQVTEA